jgi:hypothetical protein
VVNLSFHEERKFKEWAAKLENALSSKSHQLRYCCDRLVHWSNRIEELNPGYYLNNIRGVEFSLISRALPGIFDDYNQYLLDSKRHGKYTKVRQKKIMSFVYPFTSFLIPLAEEVGDNDFLKDKIKRFMKGYLPDILFDLSNIDEYQMEALLRFLSKARDLEVPDAAPAIAKVETEILNRHLVERASRDLEGESIQVEFKEELPDNIQKLAKELAAFASTEGGRIYLGVDDDGRIAGINEAEIISYDKFQQRIAGITTNIIRPAISVMVQQYRVGDKMILQINVPKGSEPVYYVRNVPYVRVLTTTRPATPFEVKALHLQHFIDHLRNSV